MCKKCWTTRWDQFHYKESRVRNIYKGFEEGEGGWASSVQNAPKGNNTLPENNILYEFRLKVQCLTRYFKMAISDEMSDI